VSRLLIPNTCQVPNVLLDEIMPTLPGSSLKVLLAVVRKTYGFGKRSDKISFRTLRELTGLSRDAVNRGIKGLGALVTIVPGAKGVPTLEGVNEYALNLNIETGELVRKSDQSEKRTSPKNLKKQVRKSDSSKPNSSKPKYCARKDPESLRAFDRFYQEYPRHCAKEAAERAWFKLNPDSSLVAEIMTGLARYSVEVRDSEPKFIAHPATWLNQRRWTDETCKSRKAHNYEEGAFPSL
jgi:phage replication O-like protein O